MLRRITPLRTASLLLPSFLFLTSHGAVAESPDAAPEPVTVVESKATLAQLGTTSRFLAQSTFGADRNLVKEVHEMGRGPWLNRQFDLPPSEHMPLVVGLEQILGGFEADGPIDPYLYRRYAWWQNTLVAPDQVRQRVAFALSEIFVVSDQVSELADDPRILASYYDTLVRGAFGNYRDLLRDVTLHPAMGLYLSHLFNRKSDPATGSFPDENYAREVMQLFSIGLYELKINGTRKLDAQGQPIPTYGNREITELAKVFTGLGLARDFELPYGETTEEAFVLPMEMYEEHHEQGEKHLLRGFVVPAGQDGMTDVEAAVDHLFRHPNVGPFISRLLIQRLVTSNPSPAYVKRVAKKFNNNGQGVRGDLRAVIRQILLDPEARQNKFAKKVGYGHLQEPVVRSAQLYRIFHARSPSGAYLNDGILQDEFLQQHPMSSPSVFNFFSPDHLPNGTLANNGLVAPEFQLATSTTLIGYGNFLHLALFEDEPMTSSVTEILSCDPGEDDECEELPDPPCMESGDCPDWVNDPSQLLVQLDLSPEIQRAGNIESLINHLDLLLTYGKLSGKTRNVLRQALGPISDPEIRARLAIYLMMLSPDYMVAN